MSFEFAYSSHLGKELQKGKHRPDQKPQYSDSKQLMNFSEFVEAVDKIEFALSITLKSVQQSCEKLVELSQTASHNSLVSNHIQNERKQVTKKIQEVESLTEELVKLRLKVAEEHLDHCDEMIVPILQKRDNFFKVFAKSIADMAEVVNLPVSSKIGLLDSSPETVRKIISEPSFSPFDDDAPYDGKVLLSKLKAVPYDESIDKQTLEDVRSEIIDLNTTFLEFSKHIQIQGECLTEVESNIQQTNEALSEGNRALSVAAKYHMAFYPIIGAIAGGILAGPVGLVAGVKGASMLSAALGAGVGATAGVEYKKRTEASLDPLKDMAHSKAAVENNGKTAL